MERLLLIDSEPEHAGAVARSLRSLSFEVAICTGVHAAVPLLESQSFAAIVIVTLRSAGWDGLVETIRQVALQKSEPLPIVCLMRGAYRGPAEKVYAIRKGFQLIYEQ